MFFRPVAFLVRPLTAQDETKAHPVALIWLLRGMEPVTAHAWWIFTWLVPCRLVEIPSDMLAVTAWCCGLVVESASYGPITPNFSTRGFFEVTSPLEFWHETFSGSTRGYWQVPLWIYPEVIPMDRYTAMQWWFYLTHSWGLGLQASRRIHSPVGHACTVHVSRCLDSSETKLFCLGPWGAQLLYLAILVLLYERL